MNKKNKKIIFLILICFIIIGIGVYVGLYFIQKNKISYTINDTLEDGNGRTATVILLAGQSNASGCSLDSYLKNNVSDDKYEEYKNGYDNVYINYLSGSNMSNGFVKCRTLQGEIEGGFGPELGMAEKLNELYPDEMFFIIKCAWGGTNLYDEWLSPSSKGNTGKLYKHFTAFTQANIDYLLSKNYNIEIKGMCWMQGESDSFDINHAKNYGNNLENFISDLRKEFKKYSLEGKFVFVDAYIADNPVYWVYCEYVNECKKNVSTKSEKNLLVDTIKNGLVCSNEPIDTPDLAHYDSLSEIKLGHLFIEELLVYL